MISGPPSPSDEILARQSQRGSLEAFEELVLRYEKRVYAFVVQSCRNGNGMDAGEITQETFVKAYQSIDQFDLNRAFAPWLFTIARRKCIDHFRSAKGAYNPKHSASDTRLSNQAREELCDERDPAEIIASEDERRHLWSLARRILSQSQFESLWLHYVEEMSIAEVARVIRRPQTYIKVLLFRARRTLAERLKPSGPNIESSLPQNMSHRYEILAR